MDVERSWCWNMYVFCKMQRQNKHVCFFWINGVSILINICVNSLSFCWCRVGPQNQTKKIKNKTFKVANFYRLFFVYETSILIKFKCGKSRFSNYLWMGKKKWKICIDTNKSNIRMQRFKCRFVDFCTALIKHENWKSGFA